MKINLDKYPEINRWKVQFETMPHIKQQCDGADALAKILLSKLPNGF